MSDPDSNAPTSRALIFGLFLIFFGLLLGGMTVATLVGPIFGLIMIGFGVFTIWKSAKGEPPETL